MDVLDDGEVVIQHLVEAKTGSKRIVDVFRVSSDGQKVNLSLSVHLHSFAISDHLLPAGSETVQLLY